MGRPIKISTAIREWAYPRIYTYGKLATAKRTKDAKAFKSATMEEFEKSTLSDPMDQVHLDVFPVSMTRKELKTVRMPVFVGGVEF